MNSSAIKYAVMPCKNCPWRTDVPPGEFPPERYIALAHTAYDMARQVFACHKSPEGEEHACAGFLLQSSAHNLTLRLAGHAFDVKSHHPLYPNYRALAVANGVPADHPALSRCRDDGQR
jgi:hypothetical protein